MMLRANTRFCTRGICQLPSVVHRAYLRLAEDTGRLGSEFETEFDMEVGSFSARLFGRAPGNTRVSALRNTKRIGKPATCETAALTHGHASDI